MWLAGNRKKDKEPSTREGGLFRLLVTEKANDVENEEEVFDCGSKRQMGLL